MNTNDRKHRMIFLSPLILILYFSMACKLLSSSVTQAPANTEAPREATPPQLNTAVPTSSQPTESSPTTTTHIWQHNWLHFGVDSQFSSYNPDETRINQDNIADLTQLYGAGCNDQVFSVVGGTPALYHGRIIITYAGGQLEAGDPYSGDMFWHFGDHAYARAPPPVISTDGIIYYLYVTSDASAKLYAVNAETGQQIWEAATQFKTGFNFDAQATVDEKNGLVYILEDLFGDGRLYAVERKTGEVKWFLGDKSQVQGQMTFAGHIVLLKDDKLYLPASTPEKYGKQARMVRVDIPSQKVDLEYDIPEGVTLSSHVAWHGMCNNRLFESYQASNYSDPANVLAAHSLDQPGVTWQINVPGQSGRLACDAQKDMIYIPTDQGLYALEASTGKTVWEHKSIKSVFSPTIANGIIYFISDTNMYAVDQQSGNQLFRYPLGVGADPSTGVAVNDGLVIFSGSGGTCDLYVLGLK